MNKLTCLNLFVFREPGGLKFEGAGRSDSLMCASVQQSSEPNRLFHCQTFYVPIFNFEYHIFKMSLRYTIRPGLIFYLGTS